MKKRKKRERTLLTNLAKSLPPVPVADVTVEYFTGHQLLQVQDEFEGEIIDPEKRYSRTRTTFGLMDHFKELQKYRKRYGNNFLKEYQTMMSLKLRHFKKTYPEKWEELKVEIDKHVKEVNGS